VRAWPGGAVLIGSALPGLGVLRVPSSRHALEPGRQ
jgi:hypothetical protein